jgi:hypothetical protein
MARARLTNTIVYVSVPQMEQLFMHKHVRCLSTAAALYNLQRSQHSTLRPTPPAKQCSTAVAGSKQHSVVHVDVHVMLDAQGEAIP